MALYLELFHGRKNPDLDMDDWGGEGPILGPLQYFHITYKNDYKLKTADGKECHVPLHEDMVFYDGVFYGDWSLFDSEAIEGWVDDLEKRKQPFDESKTVNRVNEYREEVYKIAMERYALPSDCLLDHHLLQDDRIEETMQTTTAFDFVEWYAEKMDLINVGEFKY